MFEAHRPGILSYALTRTAALDVLILSINVLYEPQNRREWFKLQGVIGGSLRMNPSQKGSGAEFVQTTDLDLRNQV